MILYYMGHIIWQYHMAHNGSYHVAENMMVEYLNLDCIYFKIPNFNFIFHFTQKLMNKTVRLIGLKITSISLDFSRNIPDSKKSLWTQLFSLTFSFFNNSIIFVRFHSWNSNFQDKIHFSILYNLYDISYIV